MEAYETPVMEVVEIEDDLFTEEASNCVEGNFIFYDKVKPGSQNTL